MPLVVDTFKAGTIDATQSITINGQPITGGDGWITETIEVSSTEILNLGSQDVELLPAPGENKYYTWYGVVEFFPGLNFYSGAGTLDINMGTAGQSFASGILESEEIVINVFNLFSAEPKDFSTNDNVTLGYTGLSAITSGDGTLKIKITYKINEI
jgi:hypothetical protein